MQKLTLGHVVGKLIVVVAIGSTALVGAHGPAAAQADYSGERLELIIPFGEGGGSDAFGRFMAQYMEEHLPGQPTILPRNIPGGGSITGANYFQENAGEDGTMTMVLSPSPLLNYVVNPEDDRLNYDPRDWNPVIGAVMGRVIYANSSSGVETVADLAELDGTLKMGLESPTGSDMVSLLALHLLGVDVDAVFGFTGGGPIRMAFERGEFDINWEATQNYMAATQNLVDEGIAVPLFSFGVLNDNGEFVRDPNFPDLPHFVEAYQEIHGQDPSGPGFDAFKALFQAAVMSSKAIVLPGNTEKDALEAYEQAMATTAADPQFQADASRFLGDYPVVLGEAAKRNVEQATNLSEEARAWLHDWLSEEYDVQGL